MNVSKIIVGLVAAAIAGSSFAVVGGGEKDNKNGGAGGSSMVAADKKVSDRGLSRMQKNKVKKDAKKYLKAKAAEKNPEAAAVMHKKDGAKPDFGRDNRNLGGDRNLGGNRS